jgi:hypothetical protein
MPATSPSRCLRPVDSTCELAVACLIRSLGFSRRKAEVSLAIHAGLSESRIALWLGCSQAVVHTHVRRVYAQRICAPSHVSLALLVDRALSACGVGYSISTAVSVGVSIPRSEVRTRSDAFPLIGSE